MSYYYGHRIYLDENQEWRYLNDDGLVGGTKRPCVKCNELPTEDGHDPCIANIPNIVSACCGHGVEDGYILFEDDFIIGGTFEKIERIKTDQTNKPKR